MSATIRMQGPSHAAAMAYNRLMKPLQRHGLALACAGNRGDHARACRPLRGKRALTAIPLPHVALQQFQFVHVRSNLCAAQIPGVACAI